jgi:WhiB family redox-sensing transcriptional regulator
MTALRTVLRSTAAEQGWKPHAVTSLPCRQEDPDLFFPIGDGEAFQPQINQAKAICFGCPVRSACLETALAARDLDGVWGGTSPSERRALLAKRGSRRHMRPAAAAGDEAVA